MNIYQFESVTFKSYIAIVIYLIINILPLSYLKFEWLFAFLMIISMTSMTIFMGSDYLKSTKNINLLILWLALYATIYLFQSNFINTKLDLKNKDVEFMFKIIRLPLIGIIYSQIFRFLFVLKYKYEPNMYWNSDNIGKNIFNKGSYHREDYIWFYLGRFIIMILILFVNLVIF